MRVLYRNVPQMAASDDDLLLDTEVCIPLRPVHDRDGVKCGKAVAVLQANGRD